MATILEFRPTEDTTARIDKPGEGTLGEIIIFPGVRIERHATADAPQHAPATTRRRTQRARKKSRA
jgi:hypothetical protein